MRGMSGLELGKIRLISWDVASAQDIFDRFGQHLMKSSAGYVFRGDIRMLKDDLHEAELDYRQALAIDPKNQPALGRLAICLLGQEKRGEAEKVYETPSRIKTREFRYVDSNGQFLETGR